MSRIFPFLILVLLTGCASQFSDPARQTYWDTQRATQRFERDRLLEIYGESFTRGFLDVWDGVDNRPGDRFGVSNDPDDDFYKDTGYLNGRGAGMRAKIDYELKQAKARH
jgi:hypothetical protein